MLSNGIVTHYNTCTIIHDIRCIQAYNTYMQTYKACIQTCKVYMREDVSTNTYIHTLMHRRNANMNTFIENIRADIHTYIQDIHTWKICIY